MANERTGIKYIGKEPYYKDRFLGTGLVWKQGETLPIPVELAKDFLKHRAIFQEVPGFTYLGISTSSAGVVVVAGGKTINLLGTSSPAILYDDDVVFTATELIRAAGGYVKQIRCISGTATLDLYDSVDWTGRKLYTGTVSAGDVIDVNAIALNGVSAKVVGTVSISISHTGSI